MWYVLSSYELKHSEKLRLDSEIRLHQINLTSKRCDQDGNAEVLGGQELSMLQSQAEGFLVLL